MAGLFTICEVHRQLYKKLKPLNDPEILALLEIGFDMGKKMDNKLVQFKKDWCDGWWEKNKSAGGNITQKETRLRVGLEQEYTLVPNKLSQKFCVDE